jgi:hypothetical protein
MAPAASPRRASADYPQMAARILGIADDARRHLLHRAAAGVR